MRKIKKRFWACLLTFMLLFTMGGGFPLGVLAGSETDVTNELENVNWVVKQNGVEIPEGGEIRFEDPVDISLSFSIPQDAENTLLVNPGDYAQFAIPDMFILNPAEDLKLEALDEEGKTIEVGTARFHTEGELKGKLTVTFNNGEIFEEDYYDVSCTLNARLEYSGEEIADGSEGKEVLLLGTTYKVVPTKPDYSITKEGQLSDDGHSITWTVVVKAEKATNPPTDGSLAGFIFEDDLANVGKYIDGSFEVEGNVPAEGLTVPSGEDTKLLYTFPEGAKGEQTITFDTEVPESKLLSGGDVFNTGNLLIEEDVPLLDNEGEPVSDTGEVEIPTPTWITKTGEVSGQGSDTAYSATGREITWTITINEPGVTLNGVKITDKLPGNLIFKSASWQEWNGTDWGPATTITPVNNVYTIGTINDKVQLIIICTVPDEDVVLGVTSYNNTATLEADKITGTHTGSKEVNVGYAGFTKSGAADLKTGIITWNVGLNPKSQNMSDIRIYDLFVYGKDKINKDDFSGLTKEETVSGGPTIDGDFDFSKLTQNLNQKFAGGFEVTSGTAATHNVYTLKDAGGKAVADLLVIDVPDNTARTFTFKTKVTNPEIYAVNNGTSNNKVPNTANLQFNVGPKLIEKVATGNADYKGNTLTKQSLARDAGNNPSNIASSANGYAGAFDYDDKSVVYRLLINKNDMNLTGDPEDGGQGLTNITLVDTLPQGWEFRDINEGEAKFLLFKADSTGKAVGVAIDPTGIVTMGDPVTEGDVVKATFTFAKLEGAYIILLKAGLTEDAAEAFFSINDTEDFENKSEFFLGATELSESNHKVKVISQIASKSFDSAKAESDGYLIWSVEYNPYNIEREGIEIEDRLPVGLDLRTDSSGNLLLEGDNVKAYQMNVKSDGNLDETGKVEIVLTLGENIFYDVNTRILRFVVPGSDKACRLTYVTDITADSGELTNEAKLSIAGGDPIEAKGKYTVTEAAASATLKRGGNLTITKKDIGGKELEGAEFTLYSADGAAGEIVIRKGETKDDGTLTFRAIPAGKYILRESDPPEGYTLPSPQRTYSVVVSGSGSTVNTSVDGGGNTPTIINYKTGEAGSLALSKEVAGNAADKNKPFRFMVTLTNPGGGELSGSYEYIGNGIADGSIQSGGWIELAHGQSITILGLPSGVNYTVTEDNYSSDKYATSYIIDEGQRVKGSEASGSIEADTNISVAFTNTRNKSTNPKPDPEEPKEPEKPTDPTDPEKPIDPEKPTGPEEPTDPEKPTEPVNPSEPKLPIDKVKNPNSPDSPPSFILIDDNGVPLGHYTKQKQPDGSYLYVDENGIPLGGLSPRTGDETPLLLWGVLLILSLIGIVWALRERRRPDRC